MFERPVAATNKEKVLVKSSDSRIREKSFTLFWAIVVLSMGLMVDSLEAQQAAPINGRGTNPTRAAVPDVTVTLDAVATRITLTTNSNAEGLYTFADVAPGNYTVSAEARGFKKIVIPYVRADVAQAVRLDLPLKLNAGTQSVEVSTTATLLQASDMQIGGVVENKAVSDLPLNGRNFTQLMVLVPGASDDSPISRTGAKYTYRSGGIGFNVNGQRSTSNSFLIDGLLTKEVRHGTSSIDPIIDSIAEFGVQRSNYSAEVRTEGGGQINVVLKSGTNDLHLPIKRRAHLILAYGG
jgi:hypothetical protein